MFRAHTDIFRVHFFGSLKEHLDTLETQEEKDEAVERHRSHQAENHAIKMEKKLQTKLKLSGKTGEELKKVCLSPHRS